jgi:2,5-diketo-D-gluconate reductase A
VFQSQPGDETYNAVAVALAAGYRHIDTAQFYENEADVARAIRDSGIPRSDVFVTSKLWPFGTKADDEGEEGESYALYKAHGELATELALRACLRSAELLGGYVDLMLLHSPHGEDPPALYRALQEMQRRGLARSIGVSNFAERHLRRLLAAPGIVMVPAVNQIELHPFLWDEERAALIAYCHREGIVVESYSPLAQAERMDHPSVLAAATKHRSTPGQVLLRWGLQMGWVVLPKSVTPERIRSNLDLGHLALDGDDMASLCRVGDEDLHVCWDPVKDVP